VTALLHEAAERYARVWAIAFGALETCWTWAEMAQPSQQYADPLLPCVALAAQEACRLDVDCVSVIQGGIYIGEIPNPEADYPAWAEYVQAAQERAHDDEAAK
jgi:hypothetical protein